MIDVEKEIISIYDRKVTLFKILSDKPYFIYRGTHDYILKSKYIIDVSSSYLNIESLNELESSGYDIGLQCEISTDENISFVYENTKYLITSICQYNEDQISIYNKYGLFNIVPFYTPIMYYTGEYLNIGKLELYNGLKTYNYNIPHGVYLPKKQELWINNQS